MSCNKPLYAPVPEGCPNDPIDPHCQIKDCQHFTYRLYDILNIEKPLVSIIMPYYNSKKTIRKAIKSIIEQRYTNWELIIINDGGDDYPEEVFLDMGEKGYAVVYNKQENHGQAHARNRAFMMSSGQFIAYLDPDDEWRSNHLELALCKILEGYHIVYGNFDYKRYDKGGRWYTDVYDHREHGVVGYEAGHLKIANFIAINTVLHDRRLFVIVGGFEEGVVCGEDGVLWRRIAEVKAKFGFVEQPTAYYCSYDKIYPEYHQSITLKMPDKLKGIHLIGNETNGQELDIQETYIKRVEMLKPFAEPKSKKLNYIDKVQ